MAPRSPLAYTALSAVSFALMAVAAKLAAKTLPGGEIAFIRFALMLLGPRSPTVAKELTQAHHLHRA